jgi:hypothetical protein
MKHYLLPEVIRKYPNARIVITGYFPLISTESRTKALLDMLTGLFRKPEGLSMRTKNNATMFGFKSALSERSATWTECANIGLRSAAEYVNTSTSGGTDFSPTNPRVLFANPEYSPLNSYAAPQSWLWQIGNAGRTNDEVWEVRQEKCKVRESSSGRFVCHRAALFHPNRAGANAYAAAIQKQLAPFIPQLQ